MEDNKQEQTKPNMTTERIKENKGILGRETSRRGFLKGFARVAGALGVMAATGGPLLSPKTAEARGVESGVEAQIASETTEIFSGVPFTPNEDASLKKLLEANPTAPTLTPTPAEGKPTGLPTTDSGSSLDGLMNGKDRVYQMAGAPEGEKWTLKEVNNYTDLLNKSGKLKFIYLPQGTSGWYFLAAELQEDTTFDITKTKADGTAKEESRVYPAHSLFTFNSVTGSISTAEPIKGAAPAIVRVNQALKGAMETNGVTASQDSLAAVTLSPDGMVRSVVTEKRAWIFPEGSGPRINEVIYTESLLYPYNPQEKVTAINEKTGTITVGGKEEKYKSLDWPFENPGIGIFADRKVVDGPVRGFSMHSFVGTDGKTYEIPVVWIATLTGNEKTKARKPIVIGVVGDPEGFYASKVSGKMTFIANHFERTGQLPENVEVRLELEDEKFFDQLHVRGKSTENLEPVATWTELRKLSQNTTALFKALQTSTLDKMDGTLVFCGGGSLYLPIQ